MLSRSWLVPHARNVRTLVLRQDAFDQTSFAVRQILAAPRAGEPAGPGSPVPTGGGFGHLTDS
jgi:hypothetical protein